MFFFNVIFLTFHFFPDFFQPNQNMDSHFNLVERKGLKLIQIFKQLSSNDSRNPFENKNYGAASISEQIGRLNFEQKIQNENLFGLVTNNTLVIVVQVHNRLIYLTHLIHSFSQVCTFANLIKLK